MTAYEMRISDWSSDVCSSDLERVDVPDLDAIEGCGGVDGVQERAHPRGAPSAEGILQRLLSVGVAVVGEAGGLGHVDEERSEEHTSELQSLMRISYAVFFLKKKILILTLLVL